MAKVPVISAQFPVYAPRLPTENRGLMTVNFMTLTVALLMLGFTSAPTFSPNLTDQISSRLCPWGQGNVVRCSLLRTFRPVESHEILDFGLRNLERFRGSFGLAQQLVPQRGDRATAVGA